MEETTSIQAPLKPSKIKGYSQMHLEIEAPIPPMHLNYNVNIAMMEAARPLFLLQTGVL